MVQSFGALLNFTATMRDAASPAGKKPVLNDKSVSDWFVKDKIIVEPIATRIRLNCLLP